MKGILQVFSRLCKMNNPQKVFRSLSKKFKIFPHIPVICPSVVDVSKKSQRKMRSFVLDRETGELVILQNSSDCVDAFSRHSNSFGGLRRLYSPLFVKRPPSGSPDGGLFSDLFFFQGQRLFAEHGQKRLPLHGLMLHYGAEDKSFDPIVVSGPNGSLPHGVPSEKVIQAGEFVTMDFGCIYHGYCSDMTRTVAVGSVTDEMRQVYDTVLQAQLAGIAAARAGATGKAVDGAARDIIRQAGYGPCFGHSFGHSVGVEIHEGPNATPSNDKPLPAGAVISAEPGIYLPGKLGVRIEDVLYLTPEGCQNLTLAPKELVIL